VKALPCYLLDVSVLVALGVRQHQFHERAVTWAQSGQFSTLFTCPITELGFVRVLAQTLTYRSTVEQAQAQLAQWKSTSGLAITFIDDDQDVAGLPAWVKTGRQTTNGHLVQLAHAHGAVLATLDGKIPGTFLIP
jgi:uncharacterized protein